MQQDAYYRNLKDQPQKNPLPSSARNGAYVNRKLTTAWHQDREPGSCAVQYECLTGK